MIHPAVFGICQTHHQVFVQVVKPKLINLDFNMQDMIGIPNVFDVVYVVNHFKTIV